MLLQFPFQALKQGQGIRGGPGEPHNDLAVIEFAHLFGPVLHHHVPQGDLAVPGYGYLGAVAHH